MQSLSLTALKFLWNLESIDNGQFHSPNQNKVKLTKPFLRSKQPHSFQFQSLVSQHFKIRDPSFFPLPLIFNSSLVFFSSVIRKNSLFLFRKNPLIAPRLLVTYFFIWWNELIWFYVLLIKIGRCTPLYFSYTLFHWLCFNPWLEK